MGTGESSGLSVKSENPVSVSTPSICRMTLTNWLEKVSKYVTELIKIVKDSCLEKDAIVNCDKTWCRVKVEDRYRKKYILCLVNKAAKVVIYCYEDGSRGRDALRHILGDS